MHTIFHILLVLEIKDTWLSITASFACTLLFVPISGAADAMPFFDFNFFTYLMGMKPHHHQFSSKSGSAICFQQQTKSKTKYKHAYLKAK